MQEEILKLMKKTCENVLTRISIYVIIITYGNARMSIGGVKLWAVILIRTNFAVQLWCSLRLEDLAAKLSINPCTLHRKIKANGNFSRSEIVKIVKVCNLNESAACDIFFSA